MKDKRSKWEKLGDRDAWKTPKLIVTNEAGYNEYLAALKGKQLRAYSTLVQRGIEHVMCYTTPMVMMADAKSGYHLCDWPRTYLDPILYSKAPASEQAVAA